MKLRSLILFGAGIATGLASPRTAQRRTTRRSCTGPQRTSATTNPALRALSSGSQKLSDRATVMSLEAIRKARGRIRDRLGESTYDDAAWS